MPINPTPPLVGGTTQRDNILQGYVFQSGIHKPEHSNILSYKYPQYYMTALLERLGPSEGIGRDTFTWNVQDRTRKGNTVAANLTAFGSTTITFDTTFVWSSASDGYLIVGDILRFESGVLGKVTATADNGGAQEVTVLKLSTGAPNWATGDINASDTFGHVSNAFEEASEAPLGRLYLPEEEFNYLQIIRRSFKMSGDELTNKTYLNGGESWYFTQEDIEMKEFALDRELAILFGEATDDGTTKTTRGIYSYANELGVTNGFAAAAGVSEQDIQDHIKDLLIQGASNTLVALCGAQFFADAQRALSDYAIAGAQSYDNKPAGLDFQSYQFMGKMVHFAHYTVFDDDQVTPSPQGGPGAFVAALGGKGDADFTNTSLWLDFGNSSSGEKLIKLCHKELDGVSRKFVHGYELGMANPNGAQGGHVSHGGDYFSIHYLSQIGIKVLLPHRLGILRATS